MSDRSDLARRAAFLLLISQVTHTGCDRQRDSEPLGLPLASIEQEFRIGAIDDPDFGFGEVLALEVGPGGSILSLHHNESMAASSPAPWATPAGFSIFRFEHFPDEWPASTVFNVPISTGRFLAYRYYRRQVEDALKQSLALLPTSVRAIAAHQGVGLRLG